MDFDAAREQLLNIAPPGGWYSSGTDPEGIKDPTMKAEYKKRFEENRRYARHYTQQAAVFGVIDRLARIFRQGFTGLAAQDISNMLARNSMSSSYGDDFLRRMETQGP